MSSSGSNGTIAESALKAGSARSRGEHRFRVDRARIVLPQGDSLEVHTTVLDAQAAALYTLEPTGSSIGPGRAEMLSHLARQVVGIIYMHFGHPPPGVLAEDKSTVEIFGIEFSPIELVSVFVLSIVFLAVVIRNLMLLLKKMPVPTSRPTLGKYE